jgi:hypothetical protein
MKHKLIFSVLFFLSITFCYAQKLTPEILHGQWQVVAIHLPNQFFYNSLTDSITIEDKKQLKEMEELIKTGPTGKHAYDSMKNVMKIGMQKNILTFDEKGNMVLSLEDPSPIFYFSKRKGRFSTGYPHGRFLPGFLEGSFQNGLLMLTLTDQSISKTLWLQKIE